MHPSDEMAYCGIAHSQLDASFLSKGFQVYYESLDSAFSPS